jgi:anthranilate/para-aminobenzoate synthase component I
MGGVEIASSSPERLVRVKKESGSFLIETRPIAGTCPRGLTYEEDQARIAAMYKDEKERAEHLMLVDLERNDIGKVAQFGTVSVDALMALERYSHVSHLVSNIVGRLRESVLAADVIRALFPGGTITGVPKVRCMQIIAEMETRARGLYTGAIGMIDFSGEIDLNIVIRSFIRQGSELSFQVGAGIVADSNPKMEYQETLHKAAALMKALGS